jgi:outer membrane protein OmpA-like peptidoglycan-associated protein
MIGMSQNLKLMLMGLGVMGVVAIGGLYAVDAFTPSVDNSIAPVYNPQKKVRTQPSQPEKTKEAPKKFAEQAEQRTIAHFVAERRPENYRNLTRDARKVLDNIEVRISNAPTVNVEQEGLEAIARTLSTGEYFGQTVYLLSIAETVGTVFLAEQRGEFAKKVLIEKYGIELPIEVQGFGPEHTNEVKPAQIEVWIK